MSQPAARIGDMHVCPMSDGPKPHVGGPVSGPCCANVLIGGMPAATVGDMCTCTGPPDAIAMGSNTVLIGGKPAARMGDVTAHGGSIILGCFTVLIGSGAGAGGGAAGGAGGANNQFDKKGAQQLMNESNAKSLQESAKKDDAYASRNVKKDYSAQYTLNDHTGKPKSQVPYEIRMNDGTIHKGKTNGQGQTLPVQGYTVGDGVVSFERK